MLSEHILCKENIVIVKKFDHEILTYLYVMRSPEFIYDIFMVMYVCVYVSEHTSKPEHSIELKFGMYIIGCRWTNSIDFGECHMHSSFTVVHKRFLIH